MDVEAIIFCITIGMLVAFGFLGLGIVLGRELERHDKYKRYPKINKRKSCEHIYSDVHNSRTHYSSYSSLGDDDGK